MKRKALFALMILLTLSGCGESLNEEFEAWRESVAAQETVTFSAAVTEEGEETSFTFGVDAVYDGEETVVTVTAPETIAGISFRRTLEGDRLEYDGLILSVPGLGDGQSPCEAAPLFAETLLRGELLSVGRENGLLTASLGAAGGETVTLWRTEENKKPIYAEISREGRASTVLRFSRWD